VSISCIEMDGMASLPFAVLCMLSPAEGLDVCSLGGCCWVLRGVAADLVRSPSENAVQEAKKDSKHTERNVQCARVRIPRNSTGKLAHLQFSGARTVALLDGEQGVVRRTSHVSRPFPVWAPGCKNLAAIFRFWARAGTTESPCEKNVRWRREGIG